ncbi:MAG: hypothetical protein RSD95_09895, partial [Clostridia bacterium]
KDLIVASTRRIERYSQSGETYSLISAYDFSVNEVGTSPVAYCGMFVLGASGYALIDLRLLECFLLFSLKDMKIVKRYNTKLNSLMHHASYAPSGELMFPFEVGAPSYGIHMFIGNINDLLAGTYDDFLHAETF